MSKMPVAGVVWQTIHYALGFERLGCEVFYVEAHGCTPRNFIEQRGDDGCARAADFISGVMNRFGFGDRWAYDPLWNDDRTFGKTREQLRALYASADAVINLHGGTEPAEEHGSRLIYIETDPVELQIELYNGLPRTEAFLAPHAAFFTFGENLGAPDCLLPLPRRFRFKPTRQPVLMDFWENAARPPAEVFTTIGNWKQPYREVHFRGDRFQWSKHAEFMKFIELPARTGQAFELALSAYDACDRDFLEGKGWRVTHGLDVSTDIDRYRDYVGSSRGEFTVAKEQNIRLRSGWFSDRSATYLAAGRPVVTQDTAFGNTLPTGLGLHSFSTLDDLAAAIESINADYPRHCRVAQEIARDFFSHEVVLGAILDELGISKNRRRTASALPAALSLVPEGRRPLRLPEATLRAARSARVPFDNQPRGEPSASVVVVTFNNLAVTRLCLASVLAHTDDSEVIVVDNASADGTPAFLRELSAHDSRVRVILNEVNRGFAAANNLGISAARGEVIVLLNNDTIVPPGWLPRLAAHLVEGVGAVGPVTNRIGNEAEVETSYATYGEFLAESAARAAQREAFDIPTLTMFCLAIRRGTFEKIGPLDERFTIGMLEDDDYSERIRAAWLRLVCAEDVLVHHFGQASFGSLVASGEYVRLLKENRRRFAQKWGREWKPYQRRRGGRSIREIAGLRALVDSTLPAQATVAVVSRGDDALLELGPRHAAHFPADDNGAFSGHYPADAVAALAALQAARARGAEFLVVPASAAWWLTHYREFATHLRDDCGVVAEDEAAMIFKLRTS
jgi:GT2 family glycosyltransferase